MRPRRLPRRMRVRRTAAGVTVAVIVTMSSHVALADDPPADTATPTTVVDASPPPSTTIVLEVVDDQPTPVTTTIPHVDESDPPTTVATDDTESSDPPTSAEAADDSVPPDSVADAVPTTTQPAVSQSEEAIVVGTQVAQSNTGGNGSVIDTDQTGAGSGLANAIDTGTADAIGSRDVNAVAQEAQVVLTDEAVANLLQIALIINIGAALANSGANGALAAPDTSTPSAIGTGDATAIGNDLQAYITQAANADASTALNDEASQLAISLFLGLAVANSGVNSSVGNGVAGSGGSIDTGGASAIGNDSLTAIRQQALLMGADQATIDVIQRATVLNLGFALANSGLNDISGVAGSLLSASDDDDDYIAQQLFAMLLPALLQSYGYGGAGSGTIGTGDATAVGNRSQTYVQQTVGAAAVGDGHVGVSQDVLVANVGGALANSGLNSLGSGRQLDQQTATAVVQMAAFLAQLLSQIHRSDAAGALAAQSSSLTIPFGDLLLTLDGSLGGLDTVVTNGSARANIRQISIVISLGLARANSGLNVAAVLSDSNLLAAVNAVLPQVEMLTGDATARNATVVQICQRINAGDVECLAPPKPEEPEEPVTPPTTTPPTTVPTAVEPEVSPVVDEVPQDSTSTSGEAPTVPHGFANPTQVTSTPDLPTTGSDVDVILMTSGGTLLAGGAMVLIARRRRPRTA